MKKFIIFILVCVVVFGCTANRSSDVNAKTVPSQKEHRDRYDVSNYLRRGHRGTFDGHTYIVFGDKVVHDPDCEIADIKRVFGE